MKGWGSGENGEFTFLDIVSLVSFVIGLQNLELNISQDDLQREAGKLDDNLKANVDFIQKHLKEQDEKIDRILEKLGGQ